ncbi:MAG TPA: DNA polymerase IV [Puia sp.]|uniref:DNA polymerase IV n=1 Tax=Puia sp. TaxID=2045100 RepID=UPI002CBFDA68|nr:DNA polymerase IV [Puia sp.]HVU97933.1 DNA polymerase IV [Puia sp.]
MQRKIIHIDMDAFYASVEQRDHPEYRGKPIAVGGLPEGRGGVVATASYEARKFGVRSAMPSKKALELCPQIIFVVPRFDIYQQVSGQIREIFARYTDLIEPLSLDEAFLDVTEDKQKIASAIDIATAIRNTIRTELNLTASAGISINKFLAKIASDMKKPDGQTFIGPSRVERFMEELPVEKFFGVGKVTAAKMHALGLFTGADIKKKEKAELVRHFGKAGHFYYHIARGIDDRPVQPDRELKSLAAEDTFPADLTRLEEMIPELQSLAETVTHRLAQNEVKGRTVTVKIKYADFRQITRSRTLARATDDGAAILQTATELLAASGLEDVRIRLLGIAISNFEGGDGPEDTPGPDDTGSSQLKLFYDQL